MLKTPFWNGIGAALLLAGSLAFLSIGLFTNNDAFLGLFGGSLLIGIALVVFFQGRENHTDAAEGIKPRMIYLVLVGAILIVLSIILIVLSITEISPNNAMAPSLGLYIWWTFGQFVFSLQCFYQAIRKRGGERRSYLGTGISTFAWVALYMVYNYSLNGPLKTGAEVGIFVVMLLGVLIVASVTFMKSDNPPQQLDKSKAQPLYAEQLKGDKVKKQ